jgi:uncharacterized protein (TIGR02391 family)
MLKKFERITRRAHLFTYEDASASLDLHPFEARNIFEPLPEIVRNLFDNGHYAQATFESLKFLDREISRISGLSETGKSLMMKAFSETNPIIQLTALTNDTERSEQEGYKFIFSGVMMAIRNPRGHEYTIKDTLDNCLDHLSFVSILFRRLESTDIKIQV